MNFDFVRFYVNRGRLPCFAGLIREYGVAETSSETHYEHLEPWIQWVTAHTGRSFAEHRVFRLGDIVHTDIEQIWEMLESAGIRVGAVSPMNAKHRLRDPAFFLPDPWTDTQISGPPALMRLHAALRQAVNDNARGRLTPGSLLTLLRGFVQYADARNYSRYVRLAATGLACPWRKALFLDLLLADIFMREVKRTGPGFATLFVNAAAHIQHHYMFCSPAYTGASRNPPWYVKNGADPLLEAYELYDAVLQHFRSDFPYARLMIATGLHQEPHGEVTFYWRLRDHTRFLERLRVPHVRVEPRMSRDFLVMCASAAEAHTAEERLASAVASDGLALFQVDNRGSDLFVTLSYPREIHPTFVFQIGEERFMGLDEQVAFVALKNGEHNGTGYFLDTGSPAPGVTRAFPLTELPQRVMAALDIRAMPGLQRRLA